MQPKRILHVLLALVLGVRVAGGENAGNPLGKVLQLVQQLADQVKEDAFKADTAYRKYKDWCGNSAADIQNAIESSSSEKEKLDAKVGELDSAIVVATSKIGDLASVISTNEAELKKATALRKREASEFGESEKEMMEAIDALSRAMKILKKEMKAGAASFAQLDTSAVDEMIAALGVVLNAASFSGADRDQLSAFLQAQDQDGDGDGDEELGAPAAAAHKSQSGGIVKTLEDMKEKAETQLGDSRKAETEARNNFELLRQSLTDQLAADKGDMSEEKANKAAAGEGKASAEGELGSTVKELKEANQELETLTGTCLSAGADHEASSAARKEELEVIVEALKVLKSVSGDDKKKEEEAPALLQVSSSLSAAAREQAQNLVAMVKDLAKKHRSNALLHLASRIQAMVRYGEDPFGKIKNLIQDMIAKLEREAGSEAQEKAYCDGELKKTGDKKVDLEDKVSSMTTKIDQAVSREADLKESIKELQNELAVLTKEEAEMAQIRAEEREAYETVSADLKKSISAVGKALKVLRDYYAKKDEESLLQEGSDSDSDSGFGAFMQQPEPPQKFEKKSGAGTSIIGILEVSESDFAKTLAKVEAEESDAIREYEKMVQENKLATATKEEEVKYKTAESKAIAKDLSEYTVDHGDINEELSAVLEFWSKLQDRCVAKPETYQEVMKRRQSEIEGLKEALSMLDDGAALVQRHKRRLRRKARGAVEAAQ